MLSCYCPPPSEIGTVAVEGVAALFVVIGGAGDVACISVVAFVAGVGALSMGPAVFSWRYFGAFTSLAVSTTASISLVSVDASLVAISLVSVVASLVAISLVSVVASLVAIAASACVVVVVVVVVAVAVAAAVSVVVVAVAVAVSVAVVVVVVVSVVVVAGDLGLEVGYG